MQGGQLKPLSDFRAKYHRPGLLEGLLEQQRAGNAARTPERND
jgi:hypothetical protein